MNSDFRRNFWIVLVAHIALIALLVLFSVFHRKMTESVTWLDGGANHAAQSAKALPTPEASASTPANRQPDEARNEPPEATPKIAVSDRHDRHKPHRLEPPSEIVIPTPTPRATPKSTPRPTPTPKPTPTPTPEPTPDLEKIAAEKRKKEHLAELKHEQEKERERDKERAAEKARAAKKEREAEATAEAAAEKRKREKWLKKQAEAEATPKPKPTPRHHAVHHEVEHESKPKSSPKKTSQKAKPKASSTSHEDSANDGAEKAGRAKFLKSQGAGTANDGGSAAGSGGGDRGGAGHKNGGKKATDFSGYYAMLHDRFYAHWVQPTSIIKSNQQFVTTVHFRIAKDGTISNVALEKSSGNAIMDASVMSAVRQVTKVDPLPDGLGGANYDININFELSQNQ